MGRMLHEAVAIDPATGIAYLTEDEAWQLRLLPIHSRTTRAVGAGSYEAGGRLQAARVAGRANADLRTPAVGDVHRIEWVDIENPDADPGKPPAGDHRSRPAARAARSCRPGRRAGWC